jgi:hypothetical protein
MNLKDKYQEEFNVSTAGLYQTLNDLQTDINNISLPEPIKSNFSENIPFAIFWFNIEKTFIYCNGGIGYDMFLCKQHLSNLNTYWWILLNKELNENEKDICTIGIEHHFYILLNCIYNAKEKWLRLFNKKKHKPIGISVLKKTSYSLFENELNAFYGNIAILCKARDCLVHDISSIRFIPSEKVVAITKSIYNLSTDNIYEDLNKKVVFKFKLADVFTSIVKMEESRKKILTYLIDPNNIDDKLLLSKYYNQPKNAYVFGIHNF